MYMLSVMLKGTDKDKSLLIVRKCMLDMLEVFNSMRDSGVEVAGWIAYDATGRYDSENAFACETSFRVTHTYYDVGF